MRFVSLVICTILLAINPTFADTILLQDFFNDTTNALPLGIDGERVGTQYVTFTTSIDTVMISTLDSNALTMSNDGQYSQANAFLHDSFPRGSFPATDSGDGQEDTIEMQLWITSIGSGAHQLNIIYWHDTLLLVSSPELSYRQSSAGSDQFVFDKGRGYHVEMSGLNTATTYFYIRSSIAGTGSTHGNADAFSTTGCSRLRVVLSMSDYGSHMARLYDETGTLRKSSTTSNRNYIPGTFGGNGTICTDSSAGVSIFLSGTAPTEFHFDTLTVKLLGVADDVVVSAFVPTPTRRGNAAMFGTMSSGGRVTF